MKEAEFKELVSRMHRVMFAHCMLILKDREEASDCVQDAFEKLWEMRGRLEDVERRESYCVVTARRFALGRLRRSGRMSVENLEDATPAADPDRMEERIDARGDLARVRDLMMQLPENQRLVLTLSAMEGLSNKEIESETGLSKENVRVLLSRGRSKLRSMFFNRRNEDK